MNSPMQPAELARLIDHTILKPEATPADIQRLCAEARQHSFMAVCVNPLFTSEAAAHLRGSGVRVCTVVGFPLGASRSEAKTFETRQAIADGAVEIDTVIPVGLLKAGLDDAVRRDIEQVVAQSHKGGALCKVIFETCLLTQAEKERACRLCVEAGADFVKTSTGFSSGGATAEDVALMARLVAPKLGVKASGGIRTAADALRMVAAGATRLGTSKSVDILKELAAMAQG